MVLLGLVLRAAWCYEVPVQLIERTAYPGAAYPGAAYPGAASPGATYPGPTCHGP